LVDAFFARAVVAFFFFFDAVFFFVCAIDAFSDWTERIFRRYVPLRFRARSK
jgi:hypothetical protein